LGLFIFLFIIAILMPLVMLIFGIVFLKKPPQRVNGIYGFRTEQSMKNKDTWDFAHRHFGRVWLIAGAVTLPLTVIAMLFFAGKAEDTVAYGSLIVVGVQMAVLIGTIFPTQRALKRTFDAYGRRRN